MSSADTACDVKYLLRTKTCRRCSLPLFADGEEESFPVSGVGTMHNRCAISYCQEHGLTLEQATPICKHWRSRGFCIYESTCFYKHPPEARGAPKPPPAKPTPEEIAAKAAAWRIFNSTARQAPRNGVSSNFSESPSAQTAPETEDVRPLEAPLAGVPPKPVSAGGREDTSAAEAPGMEAAPQSARSNGIASYGSSSTGTGDVRQQSSDSEAGASEAQGPGLGIHATPNLAALHAASNAGRAVQNRGPGKRNKVKNRFRAGVFRRFLLDTYGRELLASGSGVLDIAGGKGEIAFELVNLNNIPATVVEPRKLKLAKQQMWLKAGFYHRNSIFQRYIDVPLPQLLATGAAVPPQLRMVVSEALCAGIAAANISRTADSAADVSGVKYADISSEISTDVGGGAHASACENGHGPLCDGGNGSVDAAGSGGSARASTGAAEQTEELLSAERQSCGTAGESCNAGSAIGDAAMQMNDRDGSDSGCEGRSAGEVDDQGRSILHEMLEDSFRLALDTRWTHKGLQHEGSSTAAGFASAAADDSEDDEAEAFPDTGEAGIGEAGAGPNNASIPDLDAVIDTWQRSSILVGMHPDQATECIVDFAQRTRKPFALVPCCVYAAEFPRRRLPGGAPVRTHDDLIAYIVARDPKAVRVKELPFEGRNRVVYVTEWSACGGNGSDGGRDRD